MDKLTMWIADNAEFKCSHFTMRSAKEFISDYIKTESDFQKYRLNGIFAPVLESKTKAQFIDRIWTVQANARNDK